MFDACMKVLWGGTLLNFVPVFNNSGIPQPHITFRQCFVRKAHFSRKSLGPIYVGCKPMGLSIDFGLHNRRRAR
jgi:hypothetical protein